MKNNIKNRGFAITGALIAWAIGIAVVFGGGSYMANETLNKKAVNNLNKEVYEGRGGNTDDKDHSFIPDHSDLENLAIEELSDKEREGLISMREEEKLARDVYRTLYEKWDLNIFQNISYSENRHSLAVKTLLDRYGVTDPVENDATGEFTIPAMQTLYDNLVAQGETSLVDALKVGATIEDLDIFDLNEWIASTDNDDINMVYESLIRGSRNHMRSFMGQLESNGGIYTAQFLDQSEIDEILAGDQERGSHGGDSGMKQGGGQKGQGGGGHGGVEQRNR